MGRLVRGGGYKAQGSCISSLSLTLRRRRAQREAAVRARIGMSDAVLIFRLPPLDRRRRQGGLACGRSA